jgi:hypothetical protein
MHLQNTETSYTTSNTTLFFTAYLTVNIESIPVGWPHIQMYCEISQISVLCCSYNTYGTFVIQETIIII